MPEFEILDPVIPSGDVPDFPTNIVAVAGATTALVSWDPPATDGGSAITGYTVISTPDNKIQTVGADVFSVTMTGLKNATAYTFQVFAINEIGMSGISSAVTPYLPPVVSKLKAVITNNTVTLTWTGVAGALASPITSYRLTCSDDRIIPDIIPDISSSLSSNMTYVINTDLVFGVALTFSLYASSAILSSATITLANVIPLQFPSSPSNFIAVARAASAFLTWGAPASNGGTPITGYVITYDGVTPDQVAIPLATLPAAANLLSIPVPKLVNGNTYTFYIRAKTKLGLSETPATSLAITPYPLPGTPVLTLTRGNTEVTLSWTASPGAPQSPITGYLVTCTNPSVTIPDSITGTTNTVTVTGLTNGTPYTFRINSISDIGSSPIVFKIATPATVPSSPLNLTAVARAASAVLSWSAATSNGGMPITAYIVTYGSISKSFAATALTATITGLTNGTAYTFSVVARNIVGSSETPAISESITPYALPGAPVLTITPGNTQAILSWTANPGAVASPITGYVVTCTDTTVTIPSSITSSPLTITGLTNGTVYTFRINSVSAIGSSAAITKTVLVANVPESPSNLVASARVASAVLSWTAPSSNGGAPITSYIITTTPTTSTTTVTGKILPTTATISRLINGTPYTFNIVARNATGSSETTTTSESITPYPLPGIPVLTITPSDSRAVLSWTATAGAVASPITGYVVTCTDTTVTIPSSITSSPLTITGLTNGTVYTFRINSVSAIGSSAVVSKTVLVASAPDSPTNFQAISRPASVTLSWTPPSSNGGAPINAYVISSVPTTTTTILATATLPTTTTITKLTNGTAYTFYIVARNATGLSIIATASEPVTPAAVPAAPRVTGVVGSQKVTLSWLPPLNNGSAITSYTVTSVPSSTVPANITSSPVEITGLTPNTGYVFSVVAVNGVGNSLAGTTASLRPTA